MIKIQYLINDAGSPVINELVFQVGETTAYLLASGLVADTLTLQVRSDDLKGAPIWTSVGANGVIQGLTVDRNELIIPFSGTYRLVRLGNADSVKVVLFSSTFASMDEPPYLYNVIGPDDTGGGGAGVTLAQVLSSIASALVPYSDTVAMNNAISAALIAALAAYPTTAAMNAAISAALLPYSTTAATNAAIAAAIIAALAPYSTTAAMNAAIAAAIAAIPPDPVTRLVFSAVPIIIPNAFTFGANGAVVVTGVGGIGYSTLFTKGWVYCPANSIFAGQAAGYYWCGPWSAGPVFTLFNNTWNGIGPAPVITSPTPFVGTVGAGLVNGPLPETVLMTIPIPILLPQDIIKVYVCAALNRRNGSVRTLRVRHGGLGGTLLFESTQNANTDPEGYHFECGFSNAGDLTRQYALGVLNQPAGFGSVNGAALTEGNINTGVASTVVITVQASTPNGAWLSSINVSRYSV